MLYKIISMPIVTDYARMQNIFKPNIFKKTAVTEPALLRFQDSVSIGYPCITTGKAITARIFHGYIALLIRKHSPRQGFEAIPEENF